MAGEASRGVGLLENAGIAGLAGGVTSMASGGDFANGFQSGAYNVLYNHAAGGLNGAMKKMYSGLSSQYGGAFDLLGKDLSGLARGIGNVAVGIPDPVYDVANIGLGIAEVVAYGTGVGAIPIGAANIVVNSGALCKTYKSEGASRNFKIQMAFAAAGPAAGVFGKGFGVAVGGVLNRAGLLYGD